MLCVITLAGQAYDHIGTPIRDASLLRQYHDSVRLYRTEGREDHLARMYMYVGKYHFLQKQKDSTAYYSRTCMDLFTQQGDSMAAHVCMMLLGQVTLGRYATPEASLKWLQTSADFFERHDAPGAASHALFTIGNYYSETGHMDRRDDYWHKAMALNALTSDTLLRVIYRVQRCNEWIKKEDWDSIIPVALESINLSRRIRADHFEKLGLFQLAQSYFHTGQMASAEEVFTTYFNHPHVYPQVDEHAHFIRGLLYLQTDRPDKAEAELLLHRRLMEEGYRQRENDRVDELLVQYEAEKRETAMGNLQKENELKDRLSRHQRRYITALILAIIGLLAALGFIWHTGRRQQLMQARTHAREEEYRRQLQEENERKLQAEFKEQLAEVQLTALSAQMNPHFIFNCMNSIQKYVLKNEKQKALEFIQHFSALMRNVLDNSTKIKVSLEEEIIMLEKYILLEQQRLDYRFDYHLYKDKTLSHDIIDIPVLILQPYVENAIWHGLMHKEGQGLLKLSFDRINGGVRCQIEDNGVGRARAAEIESTKTRGHKGYGMSLSAKRLSLLARDLPRAPDICIEDVLNADRVVAGTRVTIYFHTA